MFQHPRFVVVDKPSGVLSVPGKGAHKADCVVSRVHAMFDTPRKHGLAPGQLIVHRLDMDTSGLMVVALDPDAQRELSMQFEERVPQKAYVALVDGIINADWGVIDLPMRLDIDNRPYQIIDHVHGRHALTRWQVLSREIDRTRVRFEPVTGRSHQLRVHAAYGLGHPILGDVLYGPRTVAPRLMLHAAELSFIEPGNARRVEFVSTPPF
ncbi:MAG: RluA family pseudouridine synthase [Planctomycetota bacterium]|nr:RluA family pseudouridine synthase [Planctomycetota bacterium]